MTKNARKVPVVISKDVWAGRGKVSAYLHEVFMALARGENEILIDLTPLRSLFKSPLKITKPELYVSQNSCKNQGIEEQLWNDFEGM